MNNEHFYQAIYQEQVIKEYQNHPLIEALPQILSKSEVVEMLSHYPYFNEKERELDAQYRLHLIQRLFNLFQVLPVHVDMESRISKLIRQGYIGRNPMNPLYASTLLQGHEAIQNKRQGWFNQTMPRSFTIIGPSGVGKSTAVGKILEQIPQVIIHTKYKDKDFNFTQLAWLRLECPHDGSVKGLVNQFFIAVDGLLGTPYFNKFGRSNKLSVNTLIPIMTQVCRSIGLGILVIDEIQNISLRGAGANLMLNFFVTLSNVIGTPLILIGTPKAMNVLQREFRQARRGSGQGDMVYERLKNDQYWQLFLEAIWQYQWVQKPAELTKEMIDVMYEESQGIIDIAIKLFALTQTRAISTGKETLTASLITKVTSENLKLVKPMLNAMKTGDSKLIAQYEDIHIPFDEVMNNERIILERNTIVKTSTKINNEKQQFKEEAIFRLNLLGLSKEKAKRAVNQVLGNEEPTNLQELVKKAYQASLELELINKAEIKQRNIDGDLRTIVKVGKEQGITNYQSLKNAGIIKGIKEVG
ncbi:AAA family ATPase [Alkalihalobacterium bogoriense]|uniref:AAA family ATPase n=1 Tax=Alkalihalobacterium bogoriense TaxID=246272 RepID=UPI00047D72FD|nr:AAA family ATPase [Alkalihalobacterium bogoriense]